MIAQPYDYFLVAWFLFAGLSTAYVTFDQFRNNPERTVMRWGFILVTLYMGPFGLLLYVLAYSRDQPFSAGLIHLTAWGPEPRLDLAPTIRIRNVTPCATRLDSRRKPNLTSRGCDTWLRCPNSKVTTPMRRFVLTAAAAALILATNAQAAETTGTVIAVNTKSDSITLSDGKVYTLPEGIEAESLKVGDKVKVTFTQSKGRNRASSLVKAK